MIACFQISTNKFLEAQSSPSPGTMIDNAVLAGYPKDDLVEREIAPADLASLIEPQPIVIVTARQARLALLNAGLLDQVEAAVTAAGGATKITWEYATQINRFDPLINMLSAALGITDAQIDALFVAAAKI